MDCYAGKSNIVNVQVLNNGNFASLSDEDIVTYSVYDINGQIVNNLENQRIEVSDQNRTMLMINIPADANTIQEGSDYNTRIVEVSYTLEGNIHNVRQSYRVVPFSPYTVVEKDVRDLLGIPDTVLTDDMIDVFAGYLYLKNRFNDIENLTNALTTPGIKQVKANRAVAISTALNLKTTIPLLIPRLESDSVISQTRYTFDLEDFYKIFDDLSAELDDIIGELEDETAEERYSPDLFIIGSIDNIVTGASS